MLGRFDNWPEDLVSIVNGCRVYKQDILEARRARQRRWLVTIMRDWEPVVRPCFIWVFRNDSAIYGGWWLYVRTLRNQWSMDGRSNSEDLVTSIMDMYPLGLLPMRENLEAWKIRFADEYHYATHKRPCDQGLAIAWAKVSQSGRLMDVGLDRGMLEG